jgi:hypothetical protein
MAIDPKEQLRLTSDHMQRSRAILGPHKAPLVPCSRSPYHGVHPLGEPCTYCNADPYELGQLYYEHCNRFYPSPYQDEWSDLSGPTKEYWVRMAEMEAKASLRDMGELPKWHPDYREKKNA